MEGKLAAQMNHHAIEVIIIQVQATLNLLVNAAWDCLKPDPKEEQDDYPVKVEAEAGGESAVIVAYQRSCMCFFPILRTTECRLAARCVDLLAHSFSLSSMLLLQACCQQTECRVGCKVCKLMGTLPHSLPLFFLRTCSCYCCRLGANK